MAVSLLKPPPGSRIAFKNPLELLELESSRHYEDMIVFKGGDDGREGGENGRSWLRRLHFLVI
jgi:hypothetical protein